MDLAKIKPTERQLEIHYPGDETRLIGLRITVISLADERMKKIKRNIQDKKLYLEARNKNFKAEDVEQNTNELIFGAMTGWFWYNPTGVEGDKGYDPEADLTFHGKKPEFTRANVFSVLSELEWIADQISVGISDEQAFF